MLRALKNSDANDSILQKHLVSYGTFFKFWFVKNLILHFSLNDFTKLKTLTRVPFQHILQKRSTFLPFVGYFFCDCWILIIFRTENVKLKQCHNTWMRHECQRAIMHVRVLYSIWNLRLRIQKATAFPFAYFFFWKKKKRNRLAKIHFIQYHKLSVLWIFHFSLF